MDGVSVEHCLSRRGIAVDPDGRTLRVGGRKVELDSRSLAVLRALAERFGERVGKDGFHYQTLLQRTGADYEVDLSMTVTPLAEVPNTSNRRPMPRNSARAITASCTSTPAADAAAIAARAFARLCRPGMGRRSE